VEYHDGVDVVFSHHVMANLVYEKQTRQQDVLWIGRERWEYGVFHLGALVGYRTPAQRERLLFDAFAGATLFAEWSATLGVKRTSLVEIVALPRESQDLVQDSLYGRLNVGKTLVVQSSVARDTNRPAFSRQKILLDTPLTLFGDRYGQVYGLVGSEYEARERPSPDYETFRQGIRSHVGTRIVSRIQGDSALKLEIKYQNIHRQGHGMSNWIQNSGLTVDMTGSHQLDQKWSLVGRIAYNGEETLRPTQPFQNRMELKLGAELLQ
jgi:hypothetical protein